MLGLLGEQRSEYGQYQHIQCCERLNEGCKPARFTHIRENNGEFSAGYDGQTDIGGCFGGQSRTASCKHACNKVAKERDDHGDQR